MAAVDATTTPDVKLDLKADSITRKQLIRRFWRLAYGFWRRGGDRRAWILTGALFAIILATLFFQYQMNVWNRLLFDALEQKNAQEVLRQAMIYVPLLVGSVFFAIANVYVKMTMQRLWREWLTN